jgi:hypothetical protein
MQQNKMEEGEQKIIEPYQAKTKLFGAKAERIQKSEYDSIIVELQNTFCDSFFKLQPAEQLEDKKSFGDIDLVCFPKSPINELYFKNILSTKLLEYSRNGHVHSSLIQLESGKQIHVDFIQSKDKADFERKYMYYSKGHVSSMIGMFAKKLNFKYGTEGFFKRFQDKRGNWHDILVSENLRDGLSIIGLEPEVFDNIHNIDDIALFISQSPLFDSSYFVSENLARRDRESMKRSPAEDYLVQKVREVSKTRQVVDENELFKKLFPTKYDHFIKESERIDRETYTKGALTGEVVMKAFEIKPGPIVGKILKFINDNFPDHEDLTEEIITAVKSNVLM